MSQKGVTLIELLIALVISAIIIAGIYRTFISQQHTYVVQEQVADMQQNVRVAINQMMREIRMANLGNVSGANILPLDGIGGPYNNIINWFDNQNNINQNDDRITVLGAFEQVSELAVAVDSVSTSDTITLVGYASEFSKSGNKRYICIGGIETTTIKKISGDVITLDRNLTNNYRAGTAVFKVKAITYQLRWDNNNPNMPVLTREDNTNGGGSQVLAENIENLQFECLDIDGNPAANPPDTRMIRMIVTARTLRPDPELKGQDGYRRRQITSTIQLRNMTL